jgi:hypothetical protein
MTAPEPEPYEGDPNLWADISAVLAALEQPEGPESPWSDGPDTVRGALGIIPPGEVPIGDIATEVRPLVARFFSAAAEIPEDERDDVELVTRFVIAAATVLFGVPDQIQMSPANLAELMHHTRRLG